VAWVDDAVVVEESVEKMVVMTGVDKENSPYKAVLDVLA